MAKDRYAALAGQIADEQKVPRDLFLALIEQESAWNPRALSPKGAQGLGQLMPGTARGLGVRDAFDPEQNLRGAARYLKAQLDRFGGNEEFALAAYNAGPGAVQKYGGVPPYRETREYVTKINARRGKQMATTPEDALATQILARRQKATPEDDLAAQILARRKKGAAPALAAGRDSSPEDALAAQILARPRKPQTAGQAEVGGLMAGLLAGEHLKPGATAKPAPRPVPGQSGGGPDTGFLGALNRFGATLEDLLPYEAERAHRQAQSGPVGSLVDLYQGAQPITGAAAAAANEAARALRGTGSVAGIPQKVRRQLMDPSAKPEALRAVSIATGATGPGVPTPLRWAAAGGDFLLSLRLDPAGRLVDPALGGAGLAVKALGGKGLQAGTKALAGAQKAAATPAAGAVGAVGKKVIDTATFGEGSADAIADFSRKTLAWVGVGPDAARKAQEVKAAMSRAPGFVRAIEKGVGLTKGAILANPASAFTNYVGGHLLGRVALDRAGVKSDLFELNLPVALKETLAALRTGKKSQAIAEFEAHSGALGSFAEAVAVPKGKGALGSVTRIPQAFLNAQDAADRVTKLASFRALRAAGRTPEEAAAIVSRVMHDYSDRAAIVEVFDRYGATPFATFGAKALRGLVEGAVSQPHLLRRYVAARERAFGDPEAKKAYNALPDFQKHIFMLPVGRNADGGFAFMDLGRFNPYGNALRTLQEARDIITGKRSLNRAITEQLNRPLIAGPVAIARYNQRPFGTDEDRQTPLVPPGAPPSERGVFGPIKGRELARSLLPSGRAILGMEEAVRGQTASDSPFARPLTPAEAAVQHVLGVKRVDAATPEQARAAAGKAAQSRREVAGVFLKRALAHAEKNPSQNPYTGTAAELTPAAARKKLRDAGKYLRDLPMSGRVVNVRGEITEEGKQRMRDLAFWFLALRSRAAAK